MRLRFAVLACVVLAACASAAPVSNITGTAVTNTTGSAIKTNSTANAVTNTTVPVPPPIPSAPYPARSHLTREQQDRLNAYNEMKKVRDALLTNSRFVRKVKARIVLLRRNYRRVAAFQKEIRGGITEIGSLLDNTYTLALKKLKFRIRKLMKVYFKLRKTNRKLTRKLRKLRAVYRIARAKAACDDAPCKAGYKCIRSIKFTEAPFRKCVSKEVYNILRGVSITGLNKCHASTCANETLKTMCVGGGAPNKKPVCVNPCTHNGRVGENTCREASQVQGKHLVCKPTHTILDNYFACEEVNPATQRTVFEIQRNDPVPNIIANVNYKRANPRK